MDACRLATAAPDEDVVYGACRPAAGRPGTPNGSVGEWIGTVRDAGIERVLPLLSDRQLARYDGLLERYESAFGADAVRHVPVPDHTFVDRRTLADDVLPFLRAADAADEPVVVHCWAGLGRTGHVLALWLVVERDYTLDDALDAVRERGRRPLEAAARPAAGRATLRTLLDGLDGE